MGHGAAITRAVFWILATAAFPALFGQLEVVPEGGLREYEIRPAYAPGSLELRRKYRQQFRKGGTSFHASDSLVRLLALSLQVEERRVFGPEWIYDARYEVYFRTKEPTNSLSPILGRLLAQKFDLKCRRGAIPVGTLVLATPHGEPGLAPAKSAACKKGRSQGEAGAPSTEIRPAPMDTEHYPRMESPMPASGVLFYRGCRVADVIPDLERRFGRLVVDETTSKGRYDFDLQLRAGPRSVEHALAPVANELNRKLGAELKPAVRRVEGALAVDSARQITAPLRFPP